LAHPLPAPGAVLRLQLLSGNPAVAELEQPQRRQEHGGHGLGDKPAEHRVLPASQSGYRSPDQRGRLHSHRRQLPLHRRDLRRTGLPLPPRRARWQSPVSGCGQADSGLHGRRAAMISRMFKGMAVASMLLGGVAVQAQDSIPEYHDPLAELTIDSEGNNYQFEHSSLTALKIHDPIEGFNRRMYRFNGQLDRYVSLPAVNAYVRVTPNFVRSAVSNVFANLAYAPKLANSLAQRKMQKSGRTTARLLLNTTIGVLGIFDVAKAFGLPQESEDFGQTLGFYGVPEGPYLVLPLLGPSTLRDTTGRAVD